MSFTIKCDKCGSKRVFTSDSTKYDDPISIDVHVKGSFQGSEPVFIDINCENPLCDNDIEVKY